MECNSQRKPDKQKVKYKQTQHNTEGERKTKFRV